MTKVSIIVPVYNVEKYISKCLDSLVNQTLEEIEIIVVNDGSPDNSQKIIDKYVKKYPTKVKSYIKENGGLGSARNYGIEKATGDYIVFVDSDDYVEINMLEILYNKLKQTGSDLVICANNIVDENYNIIGQNLINITNECNNNFKYILSSNICAWNKMYKKSIICDNKIEFRSKIWYEDVDFTLKILSNCKKVEIINEPFYNYLVRNGSIMNNSNIEKNLDILLSFKNAIQYFKSKNTYKKYYSELEFLCIYHVYICGITRIINIKYNKKLKKTAIKKLINYIKTEFPNYKNNVYLKSLHRNKKIIYTLLNLKMYTIIKIIFLLK